jgi:glycosyltransferase involved in cell wall biosynthesis
MKLNINCAIGGTGYGITSSNIVQRLAARNDLDISLFLIGNGFSPNTMQEQETIETLLRNSVTFDHKASCFKVWHPKDLALRVGTGNYYVFPFFELDTLTFLEKHHLNTTDHIFVASQWGKTVLENNGIKKPIHIAPLGVDMNIFMKLDFERENDTYIFCHVGKWENRKAQDFLIEAFSNAFDYGDNVELRLAPYNPFLNKEELNQWYSVVNNSKLNQKIKIYNRFPTQQHLSEFINEAQCCIFPSRAEGWNNEILECMALDKPVIATNYSAHTEYCNKENCFLIDIDELEIAMDNKWFFGEGSWAKLGDKQMEQTVEYMRYVYKNNICTNQQGVESAKKYSWDNTANIIYNVITQNG